jgi:phosphatidylinositol alpha-mannosyltransferase
MKIAMLSPYSLSRPGGVQGQVLGLSRALGALGHEVTVLGPEDVEEKAGEDRVETGLTQSDQVGDETSEMALSPEESGLAPEESGLTPEIYALGRPRGLRSNGSVAPVTISPMAAARAERFVRKGGFDVLHLHEPLAPMAPYGSILHASVPMVGTYHRSGVSRWVHVFKPLAQFVGYRLQVRVAVSEAAAETGRRSSGGVYEVLFNGVDMTRFDAAEDRARHLASSAADRPTILFLGRHEHRKGLSVLLDAFSKVERPAELWVAGDGPENEVQRRRHPQSDRVKWLGMISDEEVAARLLAADVLCAPSLRGESFGMVVLEGMAARCAVVASDLEGYRAAAGGHAVLVPPGDVSALARALGVALADVVEGSGQSTPEALKAAEAHAQGWSMDTLAEHYVEYYKRAIAMYDEARAPKPERAPRAPREPKVAKEPKAARGSRLPKVPRSSSGSRGSRSQSPAPAAGDTDH